MDKYKCKAYISKLSCSKNFMYKDTLLLEMSANYISAEIPAGRSAQSKINAYIEKELSAFYRNASGCLLDEARCGYLEAINNGYPFNAYTADLVYNITLNGCNHLSWYTDTYTYTGGAHGSTVRASATFNTCTGKKIPLSAYFKDCNYKEMLISLIQAKAAEIYAENPIYFENYKELIRQNFNPESYFLTENSIAIYYQQYEIAPYSTGIVVFEIPFSIAACPPEC